MTTCSDQSDNDESEVIDRDDINSDVRFILGGLSTDDLSDTILTIIQEKCIDKYEDSQIYNCDVTYCTLLDSLKYLIREAWNSTGSETVGDTKKTSEKEGNVSYEDEYYESEDSSSGWQKLYDYFIENPAEVCDCLEEGRGNTFGLVSIGGTQQDQYLKTESNPNSKSMWGKSSIGTKFSAKREQRRRSANSRSKYY